MRVLVGGVGPAQALFPYTDGTDGCGKVRHVTPGDGSPVWIKPAVAETNRWTIELWTEPRKEISPDGAVVVAGATLGVRGRPPVHIRGAVDDIEEIKG